MMAKSVANLVFAVLPTKPEDGKWEKTSLAVDFWTIANLPGG